MGKGIFLFQDKGDEDASIIADYIDPESGYNLDLSSIILSKISLKHGVFDASANINKVLSYRTDTDKLFSTYISQNDEGTHYFIVFILDKMESSAPFSILFDDLKNKIETELNESGIVSKDLLKTILDHRNELYKEIHNTEMIQKKMSVISNKLLDEGEFEKAQNLIKLTAEIPPKIIANVSKGENAKSVGVSLKSYREAAELALKINQNSMNALLLEIASRIEELPKFSKNYGQLYDQISKPLIKNMEKRERGFYLHPKNSVKSIIEVADLLEDDGAIENLLTLEQMLQKGADLSEELNKIDSEIKMLLSKLKK